MRTGSKQYKIREEPKGGEREGWTIREGGRIRGGEKGGEETEG